VSSPPAHQTALVLNTLAVLVFASQSPHRVVDDSEFGLEPALDWGDDGEAISD